MAIEDEISSTKKKQQLLKYHSDWRENTTEQQIGETYIVFIINVNKREENYYRKMT